MCANKRYPSILAQKQAQYVSVLQTKTKTKHILKWRYCPHNRIVNIAYLTYVVFYFMFLMIDQNAEVIPN